MIKKMNQKEKTMIALKKARTSLDKILVSLENGDSDKQCFNVIQQNLSVIGLLKSANMSMLEAHLDTCINDIGKNTKQKKELQKMKEGVVKIVQTAQKK